MKRPALLAAAAAIAMALTACGGEDAADAGASASSTVSASTTAPASATPTPAEQAPAPAGDTPAPAGNPPAPAPGNPAPAPAPENPAPAPSTAPPQSAPCDVVTREYLITTLRMTGSPDVHMADLQDARCSGNFATAMTYPEGVLHPEMYLFKYTEEGWRLLEIGLGMDCVNRLGVPRADGVAIGCAN
ncbi:hypothetical protein IU469_11280 [Nocardia puris]|uniref:hypothetical protein n=1 Tax=Nocardia puris TaxID=208602 RepID=UPI001895C23F|nr:hypothetical protein [Nocardia puris]MBF6366296.1 hypothetical protein [Nocardia puris]